MKFILIKHIFAFIFPLLLSLYLIPLLIKQALNFNILDIPDGNIKNHKKPVPYLGGLGVYIPFIATLALIYPFQNQILWFLLGVTLLLFVGLIDDFKILKPHQKLFGQVICVFCFLKGGFSLKTYFFSDFFNIIASAFWMLLVINAFNLVDVMDGLSTLLAIVSAISFFVIALLLQNYDITILLLAFIGPLLGFFFYNKPSAKIYLGDTGSLFLGGFFAAVPLLFPWSYLSKFAYYAPIIILAVPLLEVLSLIVIRTYLLIPFYKGSPHHFSIYLRKRGWSVIKVLFFSGIMAVLFGSLAILFLFKIINITNLILFLFLLLIIWFYLIFS